MAFALLDKAAVSTEGGGFDAHALDFFEKVRKQICEANKMTRIPNKQIGIEQTVR